MRCLFLVIFGLFFINIQAQKPDLPIDEQTGKPVYTEVVQVEGVSRDKLYNRAVHWFQTYFKNPGSVIEEKSAEEGHIGGQHGIYVYSTIDEKKVKEGQVRYRVEVWVKDGRYKYKIHDIFKLGSPKIYIEQWLDETAVNKEFQFGYVRQVDNHLKELIANLKESMQQPLNDEEEDDW